MIDLHTHLLCGVDDGARTVDESLQLLRMERDSGVSAVGLTAFGVPYSFLWSSLAALLEFLPTLDNRRYTVVVSQFVNRDGDVPIPVFILKEG